MSEEFLEVDVLGVRIYSAYDPPEDRDKLDFSGEEGRSLTKQSEAAATDINKIIERFDAGGMISHVNERTPVYLDVSEVADYRGALEQVRKTNEFFMELPAKVRERFKNDPAEFLDFMTDDANMAEAVELGLVPGEGPAAVEEKAPAPIVVPG